MIFPTERAATRCRDTLQDSSKPVDIVRFFLPTEIAESSNGQWIGFNAMLYPAELFEGAMAYWRNSGDGISSRQAEICLECFDYLRSSSANVLCQTPAQKCPDRKEEWMLSGEPEKQAIKKLIAKLAAGEDNQSQVTSENVFLFPNGMNAIYTVSRALVSRGSQNEVVGFG